MEHSRDGQSIRWGGHDFLHLSVKRFNLVCYVAVAPLPCATLTSYSLSVSQEVLSNTPPLTPLPRFSAGHLFTRVFEGLPTVCDSFSEGRGRGCLQGEEGPQRSRQGDPQLTGGGEQSYATCFLSSRNFGLFLIAIRSLLKSHSPAPALFRTNKPWNDNTTLRGGTTATQNKTAHAHKLCAGYVAFPTFNSCAFSPIHHVVSFYVGWPHTTRLHRSLTRPTKSVPWRGGLSRNKHKGGLYGPSWRVQSSNATRPGRHLGQPVLATSSSKSARAPKRPRPTTSS